MIAVLRSRAPTFWAFKPSLYVQVVKSTKWDIYMQYWNVFNAWYILAVQNANKRPSKSSKIA